SAAVLNHIAVAEEHRRQGLGTAVVGSLLTLAAAQGADRALLEVETTDTGQAAARMYRGLGLRPLGAYHYRVRPEGATRWYSRRIPPAGGALCERCPERSRMSPCLRSDETTSHASPTSHGSS